MDCNIKYFPDLYCLTRNNFYPPSIVANLRSWNAIKKEAQRRKDLLKEFSRGEIYILFCLLLIVEVRSETNDRNSFTFLFCASVTVLVDFFREQDSCVKDGRNSNFSRTKRKSASRASIAQKKFESLCGCFNKAKKNRDLLLFSKTVTMIKMIIISQAEAN